MVRYKNRYGEEKGQWTKKLKYWIGGEKTWLKKKLKIKMSNATTIIPVFGLSGHWAWFFLVPDLGFISMIVLYMIIGFSKDTNYALR